MRENAENFKKKKLSELMGKWKYSNKEVKGLLGDLKKVGKMQG